MSRARRHTNLLARHSFDHVLRRRRRNRRGAMTKLRGATCARGMSLLEVLTIAAPEHLSEERTCAPNHMAKGSHVCFHLEQSMSLVYEAVRKLFTSQKLTHYLTNACQHLSAVSPCNIDQSVPVANRKSGMQASAHRYKQIIVLRHGLAAGWQLT
jgi:hypothetical protein